jgi:ubiquinone/menaquinone biosynthesis C-methylase UbiE
VKKFDVPRMEGPMARWYARQRGSAPQMAMYREQAAKLTQGLPAGSPVLEVAPGPGYMAIEIARLGGYPVTALDISRTFVEIAGENARRAGVRVEFRHGDVAAMPFATGSFDFLLCQAAFKNFPDPVTALDEMHRVLRDGGVAVIHDMYREASNQDIAREVEGMRLNALNSLLTTVPLRWLRTRAYSKERFAEVVAASAFRTADIRANGILIEVRLMKRLMK